MRQDPGPSRNLGFGVNSKDLPKNDYQAGADPGGSFISKALHEHPIVKFAAASAATMIGMKFAGDMLRKGGKAGLRLASKGVADSSNKGMQNAWNAMSKDVRAARETLDDWEGVYRAADGTRIPSNFHFSAGEKSKMASGGDPVAAWGFRQDIQQKLVRQARRMPYELPAAYMIQRAPGVGTDDVFGYGDERDRPKWYNPVDVVGDFAQQSVKNIAGMMLPIEAGGPALKSGFRRLIQHADGVASPGVKKGFVDMDASLKLLGHSAGDVIESMVQKSRKSTAAFGSGITEAVRHNRSIVEVLDGWKNSSQAKGFKALVSQNFQGGMLDNELVDAVGPLGTVRHFTKGFKKNWSRLNPDGSVNTASFDFKQANLNAARAGRESFGFQNGKPFNVDKNLAEQFGIKNTKIQQYSRAISSHIGPGRNLTPEGKALTRDRGGHYDQQMNQSYKTELGKVLKDNPDLDQDQVDTVVQMLKIGSRPSGASLGEAPLSNRLGLGDLMGGHDLEYKNALGAKLEVEVPGHGKKIADSLFGQDGAVARADRSFLANKAMHQDRAAEVWAAGFQEQVLPGIRKQMGRATVAEDAMGNLSDRKTFDYLVRNTADQINKTAARQGTARMPIPLTADRFGQSKLRDVGELVDDISRYGFDGAAPEQLKSFLQHQGVISKAGSTGGAFGKLGMRRLSLEDAVERNLFEEDITPMIKSLTRGINSKGHELGGGDFVRTKLGAVWETRSGNIVDMTSLASGARKVTDALSENFKIPLVNINPMDMMGASARRSMRETPIIQFSSGDAMQPFTGRTDSTDMWMFMREKGSKGSLSRVFGDGGVTESIEGSYRAMPTDPNSMLGRHARLGLGSSGRIPNEERSKLKNLFSIDDSQPESVKGKISRIKAGRSWKQIIKGEKSTDYNNQSVMARLLLDGGEPLEAARKADPAGFAEAYGKFTGSLRNYGFKESDMDAILRQGDIEDSISQSVFTTTDGVPLSEVTSGEAMLDEMRAAKARGLDMPEGTEVGGRTLRSYSRSVGEHEKAAGAQGRYFEQTASKAQQKRGISRRIDESRAGMVRHNIMEKALTGEDFAIVSSDILTRLNTAKAAGEITKSGHTQARAALLSMQLEYNDITQFSAKLSRQDKLLQSASSASKVTDYRMRDVLEDLSESRMETGQFSGAKGLIKRHLGSADYEYDGVSRNPFGGEAETAFVPTFGTTWDRDKWGAVKSVAGISSWADPGSFSGSSIPVSHGFQRLNSFLSAGGLGLDESDFAGPLDFYARGMIGKRVAPLTVAATTGLAVDRTLGGVVNERDEDGNRVYAPMVLGLGATAVKEAQVQSARLPGGKTVEERRYELEEGEVAIRKGRFWPIGSEPWKGGKVQYYRPSWYRRMMSGHTYTDDTYGTPMERLAYGHDFSPLRPIDPYHYEEKNLNTRPYPVTGDYFTGPWGPLTGVLNATAGKILKPSKKMHEEELASKLAEYETVGAMGVSRPIGSDTADVIDTTGSFGSPSAAALAGTPVVAGGGGGGTGGGPPGRSAGTDQAFGAVSSLNTGISSRAGTPSVTAGTGRAFSAVSSINQGIAAQAGTPAKPLSPYAPQPVDGGFTPKVIYGGEPIDPTSMQYQGSEIGYRTQELLGIYGFGFGTAREILGMGNQDMSPQAPVLQSSSDAFGMKRAFWDLNLGGLGDMPSAGDMPNAEFSEFARRFMAKERTDVNQLNPISNEMGMMQPWLPGADHYQNFKEGDPFASVQMGEARLPGKGYERFNELHSDFSGKYGTLDQFKILGDVAPYSEEYRGLDKQVDEFVTSEKDQQLVDRVRYQVGEKSKKREFSPYEYKNTDHKTVSGVITEQLAPGVYRTDAMDTPIKLAGVTPDRSEATNSLLNDVVGKKVSITYDANKQPLQKVSPQGGSEERSDFSRDVMLESGGVNINKALLQGGAHETDSGQGLLNANKGNISTKFSEIREGIGHKDTVLNTKFLSERTAVEDWERRNVYGSTFPEWNHPIKNFLKPAVYKATNRGTIVSTIALGTLGGMFGAGAHGKTVGRLVGAAVGFGAGMMRNAGEMETGTRFIPKARKRELALEENVDILNYVRFMKLKKEAEQSGDSESAEGYLGQARRTMYGVDLGGDINAMISAVPDRKREHFKEMLGAPDGDKSRILSTAGRLERRMLQSAWGMDIEQRPELDEYFSKHELPDESWAGWDENINMDNVKIKMAQSTGIDVSQMGYYPQQVAEANAINMPYPEFDNNAGMKQRDTRQMLQGYLSRNNLSGSVMAVPNGTADNQLVINAGVR